MKRFLHRLYSDYLMPSRLGQYRALLQQAKDAGYAQLSVRAFFAGLEDGTAPARALVHRHDVDTDCRTAAKMFAIEAALGVRSSFYFRLSTLDYGLMREIEATGSEASYHYEEVADFAKRHHLREAEAVRARMPEIRAQFEENYQRIARELGVPLRTVASHGDFANRRIGVINHELLADPALRGRCGIVCESYDQALLAHFDLYISDLPHPHYFRPLAPQAALGRFERICLLTHPAQWETNWLDTTRSNLRRLHEEWVW